MFMLCDFAPLTQQFACKDFFWLSQLFQTFKASDAISWKLITIY